MVEWGAGRGEGGRRWVGGGGGNVVLGGEVGEFKEVTLIKTTTTTK